jgi:glycosyltransferase involved in cell wall biosynthesis
MPITFIDSQDMSKPMHGNGCATVVASAIRVIGSRLVLVGTTSDGRAHPVGRWSQTTLFAHQCDFFPVMTAASIDQKYVKNLSFTLNLIRYWKSISSRLHSTVLTQNYVVMWWLALTSTFYYKVFYFPGLANQIVIGRKPFLGRLLAKLYEYVQFSMLKKMDLMVAAASVDEIERFSARWHVKLKGREIFQLPTAVDINFFAPITDKKKLRERYRLQQDHIYLVCVGRLAKVKGIDLLIDALKLFNASNEPASLVVVGDGEESARLRGYAKESGLENRVLFFGSVSPEAVRDLVNCADLCLVGSHSEGFSCAMVEQLACGKPLVSTDVSGADEMIVDGENGYVVKSRNPGLFADAIRKALALPNARRVSREIAVSKYSEEAVWDSFQTLLRKNGAPT